jgi:hypothetical protein
MEGRPLVPDYGKKRGFFPDFRGDEASSGSAAYLEVGKRPQGAGGCRGTRTSLVGWWAAGKVTGSERSGGKCRTMGGRRSGLNSCPGPAPRGDGAKTRRCARCARARCLTAHVGYPDVEVVRASAGQSEPATRATGILTTRRPRAAALWPEPGQSWPALTAASLRHPGVQRGLTIGRRRCNGANIHRGEQAAPARAGPAASAVASCPARGRSGRRSVGRPNVAAGLRAGRPSEPATPVAGL